ncbi:MAG: 50S ribosomal protein L17 [Spirochaetales bacterium]|nr:50S ribosomal protein L17 [Spirochaetales bacterium]
MKHRIGFNRLGRISSHRKAMCRNMVTSLFQYERISTTKAKALEVRRMAEKMITRAKIDSVHNRRIIAKDIHDKSIVAKLFTAIGPRFEKRPGGYTRILKTGFRQGDAAEMVLLELVDREEENKAKKSKQAKAEKPKADKVKKETVKDAAAEGSKKAVKATTAKKKAVKEPEEAKFVEPADEKDPVDNDKVETDSAAAETVQQDEA